METSVAISVIVPFYKAEKYLHRCMDSILAQTFTDFEVLLIDDGSPDGSGRICDEYAAKDCRVRVFHKKNGGVSSARQFGVDHAEGEYTIHVDPDDWVEPDMLEKLYAKAEAENADMVVCDFYINTLDKQLYSKQQPSALDHETVLREMFQHLHGSCWNKLIKRACYDKYAVRFPLNLNFCEDLFVNVALLKENISVAYLGEAFYHYNVGLNPNSLTKHININIYKILDEKFKEILSVDIYENVVTLFFFYRKAVFLIKDESVSTMEFRQEIWSNKKYIGRIVKRDKVKGLVLFLACWGMKKIICLIYKFFYK